MTTTLTEALLAAQAEAPKLQRDSINPHFKNHYLSLETLMENVLPILNRNGLVLLQFPTVLDGQPALRTSLVHAKSGDRVEDTMLLAASKADPQGQGSAITYARRYSLMAILGLVADEDDDGHAARPAPQQPARATTPGGLPIPAAAVEAATTDDPVIPFGKNKGKQLSECDAGYVRWLATTWEPNPQYAKPDDWALKDAACRRAGVSDPAPTGDEDIPF